MNDFINTFLTINLNELHYDIFSLQRPFYKSADTLTGVQLGFS